MPGAGDPGEGELHDLSARSDEVPAGMEGIERVASHLTHDTLSWVHDADDPAEIEEHARAGAFPWDRVSLVHRTTSPRRAAERGARGDGRVRTSTAPVDGRSVTTPATGSHR